MVGKTFTFMENAFAIQKNLTQFHYVLHPQAKLFPGSYHHPQAEGNYSSYQGSIFSNIFFPPQEEIAVGKETMQYPRKLQAAKFAMSLGSISCPHEIKEKTQSSN